EELMTAAFETAHAPPFTGRFVRSVAKLVTSDSACVCAGRSPANSVSHAGSADTVPVPVCRRNFLVAVVFPTRRAQAGVPLAAIRSPRTGAATTVSGCVAESRLCVIAAHMTADPVWIERCAKEEWAVLTGDKAIETDPTNRQAVIDSKAKVF